MKLNKYLMAATAIVAGCTILTSCDDRLDIEEHGVTTVSNFYQTDNDAEEAITACYDAWKSTTTPSLWLKNMLSDDVYGGGESWSTGYYQESTYTFDAGDSNIKTWYTNLYNTIYRANLVLENVPEDATSTIMKRARSEAYVFRAMAYIDLITYWGTPSYVDHCLSASEYSLPNGDKTELWALVESDLKAALDGSLTEKSSVNDWSYRITKGFAQALLGKAYLFQEKYSDAASILNTLIASNKYDLVSSDNLSDVMTTKGEATCESMFEVNYVLDASMANFSNYTVCSNFFWTYTGWRGDFWVHSGAGESAAYSNGGWGFCNPTKEIKEAFEAEEGANGYRYKCFIKNVDDMAEMGITLNPSNAVIPDFCGLVDWKYRSYNSDILVWYWILVPNNIRYMRYADVLLYAAEANLKAGDQSKADQYLNKVRTRAKLPSKTATMDAIKTERQLELWMEGDRFQDLVRWGDAATVLANRGKVRPCYDGNKPAADKTSTAGGFVKGKHELLPFPTTEVNGNPNIVQNPNW